MKIDIIGERIDLVDLEDGSYSVNVLMRVEDGKKFYSIDIGGYIKREGKTISLLKENIKRGDVISITI